MVANKNSVIAVYMDRGSKAYLSLQSFIGAMDQWSGPASFDLDSCSVVVYDEYGRFDITDLVTDVFNRPVLYDLAIDFRRLYGVWARKTANNGDDRKETTRKLKSLIEEHVEERHNKQKEQK